MSQTHGMVWNYISSVNELEVVIVREYRVSYTIVFLIRGQAFRATVTFCDSLV